MGRPGPGLGGVLFDSVLVSQVRLHCRHPEQPNPFRRSLAIPLPSRLCLFISL